MRRHFRVPRWALAIVSGVAVATLTAPVPAGAVRAQEADEEQAETDGTITLSSQTAWVGRGGEFTMALAVRSELKRADLELTVTIFPAVATRSDFAVTAGGRTRGNPVAGPFQYSLDPGPRQEPAEGDPPPPVTVGAAEPGPNGTTVVRLNLQDPAQPRDPFRVLLPNRDGVHPVRVELRDTDEDEPLDQFVTFLTYLPDTHETARLGVALVLPVHAPLAVRADGRHRLPDGRRLVALSQALPALEGVAATLAPTPETVDTLASVADDRAAAALTALRQAASQHPVAAGPYEPVSFPGLIDSGLQREATSQLDRGIQTLDAQLRTRTDRQTWVTEDPIDEPALSFLRSHGVERLVVADPVLDPVPDLRVTLTRPFSLRAGADRIPAVAADAGLTAHFDNSQDQVLLAHRLLADIAVLYLDLPGGDRRAVVAMPPRDWIPDRAFVDTMRAGLTANPVAEAFPLQSVFTEVTPARAGANPLVRRPARPPAGGLDDIAGSVRSTRRKLESLKNLFGAGSGAASDLEDRLLAAAALELRGDRQRNAYVEGVEKAIDSQLDGIQMPEGRSITLTARRGEIPVTFQNRTGTPVRVVVKVQSDKLEFPGGTERTLDLVRRNTTERFPVVSRTSGAFPLRITLESPDGTLVIGRARLTVRSTAASGVGLIVSLSAALFLAVWWARHILKGRRARRLVPA